MQPQAAPRGRALQLAKALGNTIARYNKLSRGRMTVTDVLRALEWNRYRVTEACVQAIGDTPGE